MPISLPRFQHLTSLVDAYGRPTVAFHQWWDTFAANLETTFNDLEQTVVDVQFALENMPDIPDIVVTADYTGAVNTDQLPRVVNMQRLTLDTDNTASATWSFSVDSGEITASFTNPGEFTITALDSTSVVTVTSDYNDIEKSRTFTITLEVADPPALAGGSASDTSFSSVTSSTHAAISNELSIPIGASGEAELTATLTTYVASSSGNATYIVFGKWQWWDGAAWQDVDTEVESDPDLVKTSTYNQSPGRLRVNQTQTGLTPGNTEKFRLMARKNTGVIPVYFNGTATAGSV